MCSYVIFSLLHPFSTHLSLPMMVTVLFIINHNYNSRYPRDSISEIDIPFFIINTIILVPFLVIKILLLSFYIEDISPLATFIDPLVLQIIWIMISLPVFVRYGTIFITLYCGIFLFTAILFCFTFPGYISGRHVFPYYYIANEDLNRMYKEIDFQRNEYEEIDAYNYPNFIKNKEITEKTPLLEDYCRICFNILDVKKMSIVRLDCNHAFHSLCLESWLFQKDKCCASCNGKIIFHNMQYKPPKPHNQKESKSWITRLHYYPIIFSIKIFHFYSATVVNSWFRPNLRVLFIAYYIFSNLIEWICLPFISGFTTNRFICVLSNILILAILFQIFIQTFTMFDTDLFGNYKAEYADFWKDENLKRQMTTDIIMIVLIFQILYLFIFGIIGLSFYLILPGITAFSIVDYIFLGVIAYKMLIDILYAMAVLHILCLVVNLIYEILVVFPITFVYMAIHCKGITDVWLRI